MAEANQKSTNKGNDADKKLGIIPERTKDVNGQELQAILAQAGFKAVSVGSPISQENQVVFVTVNADWIDTFADELLLIAESYRNNINEGLTREVLVEYLHWVIVNRINFVHAGRNAVHPRDIQYPVVMFDALARIVRYDATNEYGCMVIPRLGDEDCEEWVDGNDRVRALENYQQIASWMKAAGILMEAGLPMVRQAEIGNLYRLDVNDDGWITSDGTVPTPQELFARCFYEFDVLTNLIGPQTVQIYLYEEMRAKLYEVLSGYVRNFRG